MKKILFILATHGDEKFSIPIFKKLEKDLPKDEYCYDWIIGSPKALKKRTRFIESDLNRVAPGNIKSSVYEESRAAEIISLSKKYKYVIDIHGSHSRCGVATLVALPTIENLYLASLFNFKKNIIWYSKKSIKKGPLTQFMNVPSIEIECGPKEDSSTANILENKIKKFLINIKEDNFIKNSNNANWYEVYGKIKSIKRSFTDFKKTTYKKEVFYPYLCKNNYQDINCYKMKKVNLYKIFLK